MPLVQCSNCSWEYNDSILTKCPECKSSEFVRINESESQRVNTASKNVILTSTDNLGEREIDSYLGLVFGAGNVAFTLEGTAGKANTALAKAEEQLRIQASRLGAEAVIGITFSMDGSGNSLNRSQTITLLGTAVKLK